MSFSATAKAAAVATAASVPLFRETMNKDSAQALVDAERRRRTSVIDTMCDVDAETCVVAYYMRVIGRTCDSELRTSPLLLQKQSRLRGDVQPAGVHQADSRLQIGLDRFIADTNSRAMSRMAEMNDNENRYGTETQTEEERTAARIIRNAVENMSRFMQVAEIVERGASVVSFDAKIKEILQTVFFVVLTYSQALREVVCCTEHKERLATHKAHGSPPVVRAFFQALQPLTERYVTYGITETQYLQSVRSLCRVGVVFDSLRTPTPTET